MHSLHNMQEKGTSVVMVMSVRMCQLQNCCTDFDEILCEEYATGSHTF
jgi:hypothetical protein